MVELNLMLGSAVEHEGGFVKSVLPKEPIDSVSGVLIIIFIPSITFVGIN